MEGLVRPFLLGAGALGLCILAASLWLCVGLGDILKVSTCDTLLGFTLHVVRPAGSPGPRPATPAR